MGVKIIKVLMAVIAFLCIAVLTGTIFFCLAAPWAALRSQPAPQRTAKI